MPQGKITSYDPDAEEGQITPDNGGDVLPFDLGDIEDRKTGELPQTGDQVTFEEEEGRAVRVNRVGSRGYV